MKKFTSLLFAVTLFLPGLAFAQADPLVQCNLPSGGTPLELTSQCATDGGTPTSIPGASASSGNGSQNSGSSGAGGINSQYIQRYADSITGIINGILVPLLVAVAFIVFLYGVFNYFILGADDEGKRAEGRTFVIYAVVGMAIIFSVWGLVNLLMSTLGLSGGSAGSYNLKPPTL